VKYFLFGLRVVIGLSLIVGVTIYIYDSADVKAQFVKLNLVWLGIAAVSIVLSTLIGAFNVYLLAHQRNVLSLSRFIPLYWIAWAIGLIIPGQIGDLAALSAMLKKKGVDLHASLGRLLLDKIISLLVISLFALWGIATVFPFDTILFTPSYLLLVALVIIGLVIAAWKKIKHYLHASLPQAMQFLSNVGLEFNLIFKGSLARVLLNLVITVVKIMITGFAYWCAFAGFGYAPSDFIQLVGLVSVSSIVAYLPISVNGIGTAEITGIVLFSKIGIPDATILSVYLTLRVTVLVLAWLPTGLLLLFMRKKA
jgi:uncharacterized membrane protein YbhN (UPF0104 family)